MLLVRQGKVTLEWNRIIVGNKAVEIDSPFDVFSPVGAVEVPLVPSKEVMNCLDGGGTCSR